MDKMLASYGYACNSVIFIVMYVYYAYIWHNENSKLILYNNSYIPTVEVTIHFVGKKILWVMISMKINHTKIFLHEKLNW